VNDTITDHDKLDAQHGQAAIPPASDRAPRPSLPAAGAWRRLFARLFDMWWEILSIAIVSIFVMAVLSGAFLAWAVSPGGAQVLALVFIPLAFILDAALLSRFGATPGKAMLGLRVQTLDGERLSWGQATRRNLALWLAGLALTIPLLSVLTMGRQGWRVARGRAASYDEGRYQVLAQPLGWTRRLAFAALALALLLVLGVLGRGEQPQRGARIASAPISWTNPETGHVATIAPGWTHDIYYDQERPVHRFVRDGDHAVVMVSSTPAGTLPLKAYVDNVADEMAENTRQRGRFEDFQGSPSWTVDTTLAGQEATRLNARVLQHGGRYWRMTTLQQTPYLASDAAVAALRQQLWDTVSGR